eukprot:SAG22_NODE_66_length_22936_cov_626.714279_18_plen_79_part_00
MRMLGLCNDRTEMKHSFVLAVMQELYDASSRSKAAVAAAAAPQAAGGSVERQRRPRFTLDGDADQNMINRYFGVGGGQ